MHPSGQTRSGTPSVERRANPRFSFTASADVVEIATKTRSNGRVSDIGIGGCFVDTSANFPAGAVVRIRAAKGKRTFEAKGEVVFSQSGIGMGIKFTNIEPAQLLLLERWLGQLSAGLAVDEADDDEAQSEPAAPHSAFGAQPSYVLNELILALMRKGVLTELEGKAMLRSLLQ